MIKDKPLKIIIPASLLLLTFMIGISFWFGFKSGIRNASYEDLVTEVKNKDGESGSLVFNSEVSPSDTVDFGPFWKTWKILDQNYIPVSTTSKDKIDNNDKVVKAIQGLVASYNDPYTVFFSPEESKAFKEQTNGAFEGIGAVMNTLNGYPIVAGLLKDKPAEKAGIKVEDSVLEIDGQSVLNIPLPDVISKIRGPKGSTVVLKVMHKGEKVAKNITVTRGTIDLPSTAEAAVGRVEEALKKVVEKITGEKDVADSKNSTNESAKAGDFFVFGLTTFSKSSTDAFRKEIEKFSESVKSKIILDLRDNGGGYVDVAVDIASYFLPENAIVFTEKRGKDQIETVYKSKGYNLIKNPEKLKLVILVNGNTASASEILAGALRDYGLATIVGEKTYGKGSMQELVDITDKMSLKVTVARWYTPKYQSISGTGITPDYEIIPDEKNTANGSDPAFEKALEVMLKMDK